jgi:hypothetical protein
MTATLVNDMHWERVGVFSTSDTYGNIARFMFEKEAATRNIEILSDVHVSPSTEDFTSALIEARQKGLLCLCF